MIKKQLEKLILEAAAKAGFSLVSADIVSVPESFGDYTSRAALTIKNEASPEQNAEVIIKALPKSEIIDKIENKSGFINFYLSKKYLSSSVAEILKAKNKFGSNDFAKGEKVQIEFVSANPTGPLHLGNARGGPLGDVLANVLAFCGAKVEREYYVNDIGSQAMHFAETLFYWQEREKGKNPKFPEKGYPGKYIKELAKKIKAKQNLDQLRKEGIKKMMSGIEATLLKMGIRYDKFVYESEILKSGKTQKVIDVLTKNKQTVKKEGAVWFKGRDQKFLKDRECVLLRSDKDKTPTYYANDIAYHKDKFDRGFNTLINVWGSNHYGHMPRIKEALAALGLDSDELQIILYQYVRLKDEKKIEKMAKREGRYITADAVLEAVGRDAFRMMMLMQSPNTHIDFDLELAKKKSRKNPVYYLQYACARISGIIRQEKKKIKISAKDKFVYHNKFEIALIKKLIQFPDLINEISLNYEVHLLPHFGIELAKKFHQFYKNCPVLKAKTTSIKKSRMALVQATSIVLKNTLDILGISAPEKM